MEELGVKPGGFLAAEVQQDRTLLFHMKISPQTEAKIWLLLRLPSGRQQSHASRHCTRVGSPLCASQPGASETQLVSSSSSLLPAFLLPARISLSMAPPIPQGGRDGIVGRLPCLPAGGSELWNLSGESLLALKVVWEVWNLGICICRGYFPDSYH